MFPFFPTEFNRTTPDGKWETFRGDEYHSTLAKEKAGELSPLMEDMLVEAVEDINQRTGVSVLISEQYARPILPIVDYGYVLENGGAVLEGNSDELMDNPDVKSAYFGL